MKQVKKLLVILPLVALFVLGSLPVLAAGPTKLEKLQAAIKEANTLVNGAVIADKAEDIAKGSYGAKEEDVLTLKLAIKTAEAITEEAKATNGKQTLDTAVKAFKDAMLLGTKEAPKGATLTVEYYSDANCTNAHPTEKPRTYTLDAKFFDKDSQGNKYAYDYDGITAVAQKIRSLVMSQLQNGFQEGVNSFTNAAQAFLTGKETATVKLYFEPAGENTVNVIAYDIHNNEFVYERLYKVEMERGWWAAPNITKAFYEQSVTLKDKYLYAGFASNYVEQNITFRGAYLEKVASKYKEIMKTYNADFVTFVVPREIEIKTIHVFPKDTRDDLIEWVKVPYEVWSSLQYSSQFMNLPEFFKTRIQKVNEQGFTFKEIRYYNGVNEITGLLSSYDWIGLPMGGDADDKCCAKIFYDKAVAAAKEIPSEKKVDAASAPQAQIQAPAAQAPVTAANTTTTTAPVNTLPVTGASDSIFLFLSSAALMAVGILFFKKH